MQPQFIGLLHGRGILYIPGIIGVGAQNYAAFNGVRNAAGKAAQGSQTLPQRQKILENLRQKAEKDRDEAQTRMDCLDRKIETCRRAQQGTGPDDCNPMTW